MSVSSPRAIRVSGAIDARLRVPSSKSLTIRALAAAALAGGGSVLRDPLDADDCRLMARALETLGIDLTWDPGTIRVNGSGGRIPARGASLDLGNAGTPLRILTALCAIGEGRFVIDGDARMRERPIAHLLKALADLGVAARTTHDNGCPPVEIDARGLRGGRVTLPGDASSQYLSALLMAAPCAAGPVEITLEGTLVSRPYVDLTLQTMDRFGVAVRREGWTRFAVSPASYTPRDLAIEGDASSASYFFAAAAITAGRVVVEGIPTDSRQGDLRCLDLLEAMGCRVTRGADGITVEGTSRLRAIDADLADTPDLVPTMAALACFADGPTRLTDIPHLRLKETDRIETVAASVRALGGHAQSGPDHLTIHPPAGGRRDLRGAVIDPHGDHRLAMAFAVAGLAIDGTSIADPGCVAKSYPGFFGDLETLTGSGT